MCYFVNKNHWKLYDFYIPYVIIECDKANVSVRLPRKVIVIIGIKNVDSSINISDHMSISFLCFIHRTKL